MIDEVVMMKGGVNSGGEAFDDDEHCPSVHARG